MASPYSPQPDDPLLRETTMLENARAKLDSDPAGGLAILDSPELRGGHLGLERELLAVDALRRLHRFDEARSRGIALAAHAKGTIYEGRARSLLATIPSP